MGTVRFVLRKDKPDTEGLSPIELIYQLSGQRKYFDPGDKLRFENWNQDNQEAVYIDKKKAKALFPLIPFDSLASSKEIGDFNAKLISLKKEIQDIEQRFELNGIVYSAKMVTQALKAKRSPKTKKEAPSNQLFDFIDKYIEDNKASREAGSMSVYKSLKNHLQKFEIEKKRKVTFDAIDYAFFLDFQNFLIKTKGRNCPDGLGNVTIAKQLSTLKTFLNYARMDKKLIVSDEYKQFKIKKENLEVIALTNEEFEAIYNMDLKGNKRLDQVRDIFCFSCATGLRYSDLDQLRREHIRPEEIRLTIKKTKDNIAIPLNPYSYKILQKYKDQFRPLPMISNQKLNQYLKGWEENRDGKVKKHIGLCEMAGIVEPVEIVRYRGAKREAIVYPKYELIGVHTGRKTFATLSLEKGMSAEEVMKIGGWKSYASFQRYVKITEQRTKIVMSKAWGKIPGLKLKAV